MCLTDVDWPLVFQAAALSAFISLLRLILATLPADSTARAVTRVSVAGTNAADADAAAAACIRDGGDERGDVPRGLPNSGDEPPLTKL